MFIPRRLDSISIAPEPVLAHRELFAFPSTAAIGWATLREGVRRTYASQARWAAPRRGLACAGADAIAHHLCLEAGSMAQAELTALRTGRQGAQLIDEYSLRFVYAGSGIRGVALRQGDLVELSRVRLLSMEGDRIDHETSVETWTILEPAG
jgi:hypothetical protein